MKRSGRRKVTPEVIEKMRKLRKEGLSYGKIANKLKLSTMTVYNYLKKEEKVGFFERLKRKTLSIAIIIVLLGVACVGYYFLTGEEELPTIEYETYVNENYSFKFDYPVDWIFREMRLPWASSFIVIEKTPENEEPIWLTEGGHIELTIWGKAFLENIWENFGVFPENTFSSLMSHIKNIENLVGDPTITTIDNILAIRYSAIITLPKGIVIRSDTLRYESLIALKDNYLYSLVATCKGEEYSDYELIFEHVIDSFSFQT